MSKPGHVDIVIPFCIFHSDIESFIFYLFVCFFLPFYTGATMPFIWEIVVHANIIVTCRNDI